MKHLVIAIAICASLAACGPRQADMPRANTLHSGWDYEPRDPKKHIAHDEWDRDRDGDYDDWDMAHR